jgi:leucyl aminopeptidase
VWRASVEVRVVTDEVVPSDVDALVVPHFREDEPGPLFRRADQLLAGALSELLRSGEAGAGLGAMCMVHTLGRMPVRRLLLVGLGSRGELDAYRLRNAVEMAGRRLRVASARIAVAVEPAVTSVFPGDDSAALRASVGGLVASDCDFDELMSRRGGLRALDSITALVPGGDEKRGLEAAQNELVLSAAANRCRLWQALPANHGTPMKMAEFAAEMADKLGVEHTILDGEALKRLGMGLVMGVARGSQEAPRVVVMRINSGAGGGSGPVLGLVGKGITFDSGGLCLKPEDRQRRMKGDMSGGAAVVAAMGAMRQLGVSTDVICVVPFTENMPDGAAVKPGDVLVAYNGLSVEVTNTDAEGRLILADGLAYASALGATHLVDVATLTGAARTALGRVASAVMTNSPEFASVVHRAAGVTGERLWNLPMFPEYDVCLQSPVADLQNLGVAPDGGASHAAAFLRQFVGGRPWVHVDIGGSFLNDEPSLRSLMADGPTGVMTRTLAQLPTLL